MIMCDNLSVRLQVRVPSIEPGESLPAGPGADPDAWRELYRAHAGRLDLSLMIDGIEHQVAGGLLLELSQRERDVLACLEVVGLDVAQTGQALGMTAVAVRIARHRALHRLRRLLCDDVVVALPAPARVGALTLRPRSAA